MEKDMETNGNQWKTPPKRGPFLVASLVQAHEARPRQVALLRAVVAPIAADHREALGLRGVVRRKARAAGGQPQQVLR